MSVRLPSAMFASTRCSPQVASGVGWRCGAPGRSVSWSTLAPSAEEHAPVYAWSYSTHGVFCVGVGKPTSGTTAPSVECGANGFVGWIDWSALAPGYAQSTWSPGTVVRPKSASDGTGSLKVDQAVT